MGKHQGQTDSVHTIKLTSAICRVNWSVSIASVGGCIGLEVWTELVGNGSAIEIELSDQSGKKFGKFTEKISGNQFWTQVKVPPEAKQAFYAEVKLPKHGLQMKSNPLILLPAVEITNLKWDKKEARRGDILKLTADVKGCKDDTEAEISIWEYDEDGGHDFISKFPATIKNGKIEAEWEYEYHEDTDEIPTEEELKKYGNKYNPPEYFFRVKVGELAADSGLLEFKDWIEIELYHESGEPISGAKYVIKLADGLEIRGTLDDKGYAKVEGVSPGPYVLNCPEFEEEP